jgi:uncharacterized protein YggE
MRRPFRFLLSAAVPAVLVMVAGIMTSPRAATAAEEPLVPKLTVRGQGVVSTRPDLAVVTLGAAVRRDSADAAFEQATSLINQLNQFLRSQDIPERDVTTSQFSLMPEYGRQQGDAPPPLVGWRATNLLAVKIRDFSKIGPTIDGAARILGGDAQISGISFTIEDTEAATQQARAEAVANAQQHAQELAAAAGVRLVRIIAVTETAAPMPRPVAFAAPAPPGVAAARAVEIAPGEQNVTVSVEIVYEIA